MVDYFAPPRPASHRGAPSANTLRVAVIGGGPSALVAVKTLLDGADRWASDGVAGSSKAASDGGPAFDVAVDLYEQEDRVGGTFRECPVGWAVVLLGCSCSPTYNDSPLSRSPGYRSYPTSTLVSSKQLTSYSDFRMPLSHTDHLTLYEYCDYLEAYVHYFKLPTRSRKWRMNTKVVQIRRAKEGEEGNHILAWEDLKTGEKGSEWYDALALCTGLHVEASVPEIPGFPPLVQGDVYGDRVTKKSETAKGDVDEATNDSAPSQDNLSGPQSRILSLHSSQFKDPQIFKDQRVLIMGTGETGMDMGYLAVKNGAKEIVMCTRGGFLSFPAVLSDFVVMGVKFEGKLPIDGLISNLFEVSRFKPRRAPLNASDIGFTFLISSRLRGFIPG